MALQGGHRFAVSFDQVFPAGVYAMFVEQAEDYDDRTGRRSPARDQRNGNQLVWNVTVIDRDPEARKKELKVKVTAPHMPVLPGEVASGTGMHPVVFEGMTATPYVDDKSKRLAYSFRAAGLVAAQLGSRPGKGSTSPGERAA
jgi:hypothetical protein